MLKIRLMRIGAKKRPFYRVVVVDERVKRNGAYLELLGTYNPLTQPHDIKLKQDRIDHWVKQGAQMSDGFLRIIGKAPQRPPRKPKKEKKAEEPAATSPQPTGAEQPQPEVGQPLAKAEDAPEEAPSNTSEVKPEAEGEQDTSEVEQPVAETSTPEPKPAGEEDKKDEGST